VIMSRSVSLLCKKFALFDILFLGSYVLEKSERALILFTCSNIAR